MKLFISILVLGLLTGCMRKDSTNPEDVFKYWSGHDPPKELDLKKANYWESTHWTKEYIMYLELRPNSAWWDAFIEQNYLSKDTTEWTRPSDTPDWFVPSANSISWGTDDDFDQGSRYFRDEKTGICWMYEIQL